uniref:Uncharacterized protein n=1 Tax=Rhizophora mucronata TaxID=61149 RepID=A0A2P2IY64_RHIMU
MLSCFQGYKWLSSQLVKVQHLSISPCMCEWIHIYYYYYLYIKEGPFMYLLKTQNFF